MTYDIPTPATSYRSSIRRNRLIGDLIAYLLIILGAIIVMVPLAWMVTTALKQNYEVFLFPPRWIPEKLMWSNFTYVFELMPFGRFMLNTAIITQLAIIGDLLSCSVVAFAFARLRAPGKNFLFLLVLSTMMLPFQVTMIPKFVLFRQLDWVDTFLPLVVPQFFANAYQVFLMRQFFLTIPKDLDEAAIIDGSSILGVYWRIIMPLSGPIIVTMVIFSFLYHWNDFLAPLIYLNSEQNKTLALGLASILAYPAGGQGRWEVLMAASTIALLPCIVLFFIGQKFFVQGIALTGLKG
ncbi:MAG: sugar ABC transporter permease [Candidatus Roseilinea sp.]|nr:MAG: sugar ABC transporter permease [Candidatus Roseilinea sp.]